MKRRAKLKSRSAAGGPNLKIPDESERTVRIEAVAGKIRILEHYPDQSRCLVTGNFQMSGSVRSPLHLVFEYLHEDAVDIVTAYIPQKLWWVTPSQRGLMSIGIAAWLWQARRQAEWPFAKTATEEAGITS